MRDGTFEITTEVDQISVHQGQCLLVASGGEFCVKSDNGCEISIVIMPGGWMGDSLDPMDHLGIRLFSQSEGWGAALRAFMGALTRESLADLVVPPEAVAEQLAVLTALACGRTRDSLVRPHRQATLHRARLFLRHHLQDPGCTPEALAIGLGISKRSVHILFAEAGSSFSAELMGVRLDRARDYLADRHRDTMSVAEIGFLTGFSSPSHFIRCFRRRFGMTPRLYRVTA
ncbi:helix-turn-helix transcriptional regulator [Telmatospirillum sp.]|uniref:helix-turn-helix transcriptional regulator n=1 Tax=Telmatospirillum sp. TaxID=2079197 RepID=UPI003868E8D5